MKEKIDGKSLNMINYNLEKLKEIYPEAFTEGKVDSEKLLVLLGENVDNSNEKYSFSWNGKNDCIRLAQTPSTGTLLPCKEDSVDWDTTENLYIEGDNLEVLKLLQKSYLGKVKMIYIDPPYNTGNDFVYQDSFADNISNYKQITGQRTKSNAETQGRYHTNWLNMMCPRLKLARTLLTDDGVIFISIDDNEQANLKKLCDEVFGEDNFVQQIIWKKRGGAPNDKIIGAIHEYVLMYAKNKDTLTIYRRERSEEQQNRYKNPDNHPKGDWAPDNLMANIKGGRYVASLYFPIVNPITGEEHYPSSNGNWRFNKEKIQRLLDSNEIYFGEDNNGRPKLKRFLCDVKDGVPFSTIFDDVGYTNTATAEMEKFIGGVNIFDTPKPIDLVVALLKLATRNAIILDFFSGSATTAHAVMQLNAEDGGNRKFICVQIPELTDEKSEAFKAGYKTICEIGKERIKRAGIKIKSESSLHGVNLDTGFRVFKLDNSNLIKWDNSPTEDVNVIADRIQQSLFYLNEGRTNMDFVYEIMLKFGMPLTATVNAEKIGEAETYGIINGAHSILICLDMNIKINDIEKMAETKYSTLIFADKCFDDANMLINAEEILKKNNKQMRLF